MNKTQVNKVFDAAGKLELVSVELNDKARAFSEVGNRELSAKFFEMSRQISTSQSSIVRTVELAHPSLCEK